MSQQTAYPAAVAALAAQIDPAVVVDPAAGEHFFGSIQQADALEAGAAVESASVLDDVLNVVGIAMPHVLAKKVSGYGPMRMRFAMDLAAELAGKVAELDSSRVEAAGASAARAASLQGSRDVRLQAIRVLKNLAGRREEEKKRLSVAGKGKEKPDERARTLENLATELKTAMAAVPASVAEDAGATQALVDDLMTAAGAVLGTRTEAKDARGTLASLYDTMNVLDGRLLHELRLLVGAMTDARKRDKAIPAVKSSLLKQGKKKAKKAGTAPPGEGAGDK